jgi:hypothetical protein
MDTSRQCCAPAGPFQSLIFADSICSLATAAPLVYITKPWKYAEWRLVAILLFFQVLAKAFTHACICPDKHKLHFQNCIASSVLTSSFGMNWTGLHRAANSCSYCPAGTWRTAWSLLGAAPRPPAAQFCNCHIAAVAVLAHGVPRHQVHEAAAEGPCSVWGIRPAPAAHPCHGRRLCREAAHCIRGCADAQRPIELQASCCYRMW